MDQFARVNLFYLFYFIYLNYANQLALDFSNSHFTSWSFNTSNRLLASHLTSRLLYNSVCSVLYIFL